MDLDKNTIKLFTSSHGIFVLWGLKGITSKTFQRGVTEILAPGVSWANLMYLILLPKSHIPDLNGSVGIIADLKLKGSLSEPRIRQGFFLMQKRLRT
jgi:hypothetical protein